MKNIIRSIAFLIILVSVSNASGGGSVYSRFGFGEVNPYYSARSLGMGGPGAALPGTYNITYFNPASIYSIKLTRLETGMNYDGMQYTNGTGTPFYSSFEISGFSFGFPVKEDMGISLNAGLVPYTTVNYEIHTSDDEAERKFSGSGGISRAFIGTSYNTKLGIILGAEFNYYTGSIDYETVYTRSGSSDELGYLTKLGIYGTGVTLGLLTDNLSEITGEENITDLRLGVTFRHVSDLNTDSLLFSYSTVGKDTVVNKLRETNMPFSLAIGGALTLNEKYTILADYLFEPWSEFSVSGGSDQNLRDLQRVNVGFEYKNPDSRFKTFWEQIALRGGLSYEKTKFSIKNTGIDIYMLHGGISFPIGEANNIDVGLGFGVRGTEDSGLYKEYLYRASFTLSFGELWFVRQNR